MTFFDDFEIDSMDAIGTMILRTVSGLLGNGKDRS